MNSRERVLLALVHQEPDRVPIDFGGLVSSLHHDAYRRLIEYLWLPVDQMPIMDMFQQIVDPAPALKDRFHADVVGFFPHDAADFQFKLDSATDSFVDEWGVVYRRPPGGFWYDLAGHPLVEGTVEELSKLRFPDPRDPSRVEGLADEARRLLGETGKAVMIHAPIGGPFEQSYWLRGLECLFMDMATNKKYVEALAERVVEWLLEFWDLVLEEVGPYVHVVELSDDLGGQHGPLFSPRVVPGDLQAAPPAAGRPDPQQNRGPDLPALLWLHPLGLARSHRERDRDHQSRAGLGQGHGHGRAEARVRAGYSLLGRRRRRHEGPAFGDPRAGQGGSEAAHTRPGARGWLRLRADSQHPG